MRKISPNPTGEPLMITQELGSAEGIPPLILPNIPWQTSEAV